MRVRGTVLRGIAAGGIAATMVVAGMGTANASPAIGRVVSTNPVNYTPNINQGAVFKMAEANGMLYAGGSFSTVIAVDVDRRKLGAARSLGATSAVNAAEEDPVEAIKKLTGGFGADVVIEAVGRPETYKQAFYSRDLAGTLVLVGVPTPEMRLEMPLLDFFSHGGALKSSWYGDCLPSRDFPILIDLYQQGRLDLDRFVSATITIDEVEDAFAAMHRGDVLRSVVVF